MCLFYIFSRTLLHYLPQILHFPFLKCNSVAVNTSFTISFTEHATVNEGKGKVHPCIGTEALYRPYGQ